MIIIMSLGMLNFFFKQKTAYEMRISDWSSDVCSSDLLTALARVLTPRTIFARASSPKRISLADMAVTSEAGMGNKGNGERRVAGVGRTTGIGQRRRRSEEHTSEPPSLMRISYAVFCLKKKNFTT